MAATITYNGYKFTEFLQEFKTEYSIGDNKYDYEKYGLKYNPESIPLLNAVLNLEGTDINSAFNSILDVRFFDTGKQEKIQMGGGRFEKTLAVFMFLFMLSASSRSNQASINLKNLIIKANDEGYDAVAVPVRPIGSKGWIYGEYPPTKKELRDYETHQSYNDQYREIASKANEEAVANASEDEANARAAAANAETQASMAEATQTTAHNSFQQTLLLEKLVDKVNDLSSRETLYVGILSFLSGGTTVFFLIFSCIYYFRRDIEESFRDVIHNNDTRRLELEDTQPIEGRRRITERGGKLKKINRNKKNKSKSKRKY